MQTVWERTAGVALMACCFGAAGALLFVQGCGEPGGDPDSPIQRKARAPGAVEADFAGAKACVECHAEEFERWNGSHHQLAMQPANEETVLGDFDDATFTHFGETTRFFRRDGGFFVNATGPGGERHDYPVEYTFGVYPLQQYLIPFPGGRQQVLFICWDTRPKEEGGQRWYHLYPDEAIPHTDVLHWTGVNFNWNFMCADCHSTNLRKNFDVETDSYRTTFSEMNVSCEACHGPGSEHVEWARLASESPEKEKYAGGMGLVVRLKEPEEGLWQINPETQQPTRSRPLESTVQVETCAPCHSHRRPIDKGYRHDGRRLLDTHLPTMLDEVHYHADGQIREEVYVYGSFTQSKMFHKGVRCSDCHDPHSLELRAPGNALCVQCHVATKYNTPAHHFHPVDSSGAQCVDCHMPVKHYMVVDPRRDHSIRIPRPDLSLKLGTPNACINCHKDQSDAWAAEAFHKWWGEGERDPHYGEILAAGRRDDMGSEGGLIGLAKNFEEPALVRATALSVLRDRPTQEAVRAAVEALEDPDPIVRQSALSGLLAVDPAQRLDVAGKLLSDPVRAVRIEAARVLASVPADVFTPEQREDFEGAKEEFIDAQSAVADRAGSHMALGVLYTDLGELEKAEAAYRTAFRIEPMDVPSRVNLAELYYETGRVGEGEPVLRDAVRLRPEMGIAHEALGRYLIRQKRYDEGVAALGRAAELMPENAPVQYFYGVALNQLQRFAEAMPFLENALRLDPANREYLMGTVAICRDNGAWTEALRYADQLVNRYPGVPDFIQLRDMIRERAQ